MIYACLSNQAGQSQSGNWQWSGRRVDNALYDCVRHGCSIPNRTFESKCQWWHESFTNDFSKGQNIND